MIYTLSRAATDLNNIVREIEESDLQLLELKNGKYLVDELLNVCWNMNNVIDRLEDVKKSI